MQLCPAGLVIIFDLVGDGLPLGVQRGQAQVGGIRERLEFGCRVAVLVVQLCAAAFRRVVALEVIALAGGYSQIGAFRGTEHDIGTGVTPRAVLPVQRESAVSNRGL